MLQNHRAQSARFIALTGLAILTLASGIPAFAQNSTPQTPAPSAAMMGNNTAEVEGHVARAISILDQINQLIDGINQRKAAATGASSGTTNP